MRVFGLLLLTACLGGCGGGPESVSVPRHGGRYAGIGIYGAGPLWQRMVAAHRPTDAAVATLRDDETVIVVVGSQTGEVRQCGNLTGYCIRITPWSGPLAREQSAPVSLTEHQADIDRATEREVEAARGEMNSAIEAAERTPPGRR